MNKGSYILILKLRKELKVRKPKELTLKPGYYVYIGSAMNSLTGRIKRHLLKEKKIHWHIDQLTTQAKVIGVYAFVGVKIEEKLSKFFETHLEGIKGFGNSDLKTTANLFYSSSMHEVISLLDKFYEKEGDLL